MQTHVDASVDALFGRSRRAVIGLLFAKPHKELHLREIARLAGMSAPTIQRELNILTEAGLLNERRLSNHRLFSANRSNALFPWLEGVAMTMAPHPLFPKSP